MTTRLSLAALAALLLLNLPAAAQAPAIERKPVLLDTAIGGDADDPFALALILASPELDLRGVTSSGSKSDQRALMLCRFLTMTGRRHTQVAAGAEPQTERVIGGQYQYYYHPDVLFNRTTRPVKENAVDFLYGRLKAQPGKVTIIAVGPLTNIARLIKEKPDCKPWIKSVIIAGRSMGADVAALATVFDSGVPLVVVPPDVGVGLKLGADDLRRVFAPGTALSLQVQCLHQLSDRDEVFLGDTLAAALAIDERFFKLEPKRLEVDLKLSADRKPNARVATSLDKAGFLKWYVERMASCVAPANRPAKLVEQGRMPHRVHVAEDYDNDIERRWWMAGKAETKDLPPGSRRACRGVLTHDFDDLLGNPKAMYRAVIFNPVPGPPMGQNTRLSFRYKLKGTDTLRVQIYSLTNGYHRHLVLKGLPQDKWESATVDMTTARRPDGTGGPLSENERIDDIQFYADPTAELLIDDIVLFDAAARAEKRPFPRSIYFTGLFDSGKQGKEWPGEFEIVAQKGFFWNGAKSVENAATKLPWIRLGLRGERAIDNDIHVSFRYRLTGADSVRVALVHSATKAEMTVNLPRLVRDQWSEATADFSLSALRLDRADEVRFGLPAGAELIVDDVLLYQPGR